MAPAASVALGTRASAVAVPASLPCGVWDLPETQGLKLCPPALWPVLSRGAQQEVPDTHLAVRGLSCKLSSLPPPESTQ